MNVLCFCAPTREQVIWPATMMEISSFRKIIGLRLTPERNQQASGNNKDGSIDSLNMSNLGNQDLCFGIIITRTNMKNFQEFSTWKFGLIRTRR